MNRGRGTATAGYTVVETLIFLAVSAALFVSAMAFLGGRQGRAEFKQVVTTFQATLEDTANDVSTGYYGATVNGQTLTCAANSAGVTSIGIAASDSQGANKDCIFVGKALQFGTAEGASGEDYRVLPLVGKRLTGGSSGSEVTNYSEAALRAIAPQAGGTGWPDATKLSPFGLNVTVKCMFYAQATVTVAADQPCKASNLPGGIVQTDMVAFITTFHGVSGTGEQTGGSSQVDLVVPQASSALGRTRDDAVSRLAQFTDANTIKNPAGGVFVCLQSGGSNQFTMIKMGGTSSRFVVSMPISEGSCT